MIADPFTLTTKAIPRHPRSAKEPRIVSMDTESLGGAHGSTTLGVRSQPQGFVGISRAPQFKHRARSVRSHGGCILPPQNSHSVRFTGTS